MENEMTKEMFFHLKKIYRMLIFLLRLNVVCLMVLIYCLFIARRLYRFFLGFAKTLRMYESDGVPLSELGGYAGCRERALRILSEKIVTFWRRYDYARLVDFYQTLEDSNDKDLLDMELRNYSFRYDRSVLDEEIPYNRLPLVRRLAAVALMKCRDKVKHKSLNDLSGIFSYQD